MHAGQARERRGTRSGRALAASDEQRSKALLNGRSGLWLLAAAGCAETFRAAVPGQALGAVGGGWPWFAPELLALGGCCALLVGVLFWWGAVDLRWSVVEGWEDRGDAVEPEDFACPLEREEFLLAKRSGRRLKVGMLSARLVALDEGESA